MDEVIENENKPSDDKTARAIVEGRSDGDKKTVDEHGRPVKVKHPSSSSKIKESTDGRQSR